MADDEAKGVKVTDKDEEIRGKKDFGIWVGCQSRQKASVAI